MNKLKWWFRVVGAIYILLGVGFIPPLSAMRITKVLPGFDAPIGGVAFRGLLDIGFMFGLDLAVTGGFLIYASKNPAKNINVIWLIIFLEIFRGIFDDIYMIASGYTPGFYAGFIVFHMIVILSGITFIKNLKNDRE